MVAASAASHGLRATVPHLLGVNIGFGVMVALVGLGLAGPLAASPVLHGVLRWVGGAWMVWIAVGIARSVPGIAGSARPPMTFLSAALFQWVNPKAWVLAVATATTYTLPDAPLVPQVLALAATFTILGFPCTLLWALIGAGAARMLRTPAQLRVFNLAMAGLLVASVLPLVAG